MEVIFIFFIFVFCVAHTHTFTWIHTKAGTHRSHYNRMQRPLGFHLFIEPLTGVSVLADWANIESLAQFLRRIFFQSIISEQKVLKWLLIFIIQVMSSRTVCTLLFIIQSRLWVQLKFYCMLLKKLQSTKCVQSVSYNITSLPRSWGQYRLIEYLLFEVCLFSDFLIIFLCSASLHFKTFLVPYLVNNKKVGHTLTTCFVVLSFAYMILCPK